MGTFCRRCRRFPAILIHARLSAARLRKVIAKKMKFIFSLLCLAFLLCSCGGGLDSTPSNERVQYTEVAQISGLDFRHYNGFSGEYYYVETFGSGAAFFDRDGDGWQDIYLVNGTYLIGAVPDPRPINRLYRNTGGGTFVDATETSGTGDPGYGMGCTAADYDNDGDQDLYVTNYGSNTLLRNGGDGRFEDVTKRAGVGDGRWGSSSGFLDYDLDGDLDLFVVNYVDFALNRNVVCKRGKIRTYCEPQTFAPSADILYRNDGDHFSDVSLESGIGLKGRGLGVAFSDYDLDGDTDIYVANDATMNFLYQNRRGHFVETGLQAGGRYNQYGKPEAGMGVDFGDYDDDGWQDLFVTNFARETNTLYHNNAPGHFDDVTDQVDLTQPTLAPLGFGTKFLDYDHDADLDLFVANGHVLDKIALIDSSTTYAQPDQMLRNENGKRFEDVSASLGPDWRAANVGRGTAVADYDNDGDLDILVSNQASRPQLLRNDGGNRRHWLLVELKGALLRDGLGTRVVVTASGRRQIRERQSGGSYLSSHDPRLHFGLDQAERAEVEVHWPDGQVQRLHQVPTNQILRVVQPNPQR